MSDERGDLPSASNAARYAACPGSHRACIGLPDESSEDSRRGDRIHAWLEKRRSTRQEDGSVNIFDLDGEDLDLAHRCEVAANNLIAEHVPHAEKTLVETRFWDFYRTWSGKADLVVIDGTKALVIDYKTGRGDVEDATGNLQLRALAVFVASIPGTWIDDVVVAIVQPLAGPPSVARYTIEDLEKAEEEIEAIMAKANATGQPRNPGPWCQYCRASGTDRCPESVANMAAVALHPGFYATNYSTAASLLDACDAAEVAIDNIRKHAKAALQAGGTIPGWTLKPGTVRETITDPELVAGRFSALSNDTEAARKAFLRAVTVSKGKLKDAAREITGAKGKALDDTVARLVERATEATLTAPTLARVKGGQP